MSNHTSSSLGIVDVGTGSTGGTFGGFEIGHQHLVHPLGRPAAPGSGAEGSLLMLNSFHTHTSGPASSSFTAHDSAPASLFFHYPLCRGNVPPARWAHAAAVVGGVLWVYGGVGNSVLDDLCALDADTLSWRIVSTHAARSKDRPEKMLGHAAAATGSKIWIFGGQQGRKFLRSLYYFDTDTCTWTRRDTDALPSARAGHAMVTVHGSVIYMFGGQGKRLYNDLYKLDPVTGTFSEVEASGKPPTPRRGHSLVWDGRDYLICFGGINQSATDNQLSVFSLSRGAWFTPQAFGPAPSARTQHTAQLLSPGVILIFGGCNSSGTFFNDTVVLDTRSFTWHKPTLLNTAPAPRYHHTCHMVNGRVLIYGGINSKQTFDGVVVLETKFMSDINSLAEELFRMSADVNAAVPTLIGGGTAQHPLVHQLQQACPHPHLSHQPQLQQQQLPGGPGSLIAASPTSLARVLSTSAAGVAAEVLPGTRPSSGGGAGGPVVVPGPSGTLPTHSASVLGGPSGAQLGELAAAGFSSSKSLEAVKVQLTDLLLRRNLEEQHLQTARKAETTESLLAKEREAREAAMKELLQHKLLLAEAEAATAAAEQELQAATAKANREAAAAAELRAQVEALQAKLSSRDEELQEARLLQDGLVKELGIMASRYSRLAVDVQEGSEQRTAGAGAREREPRERESRDTGAGRSSNTSASSAAAAAAAVAAATQRHSLTSSGMLVGSGGSGGGAAAPRSSTATGAYPLASGTTGQMMSTLVEELQASGSFSVPLPNRTGSLLSSRQAVTSGALSSQCTTSPASASAAVSASASLRTLNTSAAASTSASAATSATQLLHASVVGGGCGSCCQQLLSVLSECEAHRAALLEANLSLTDKVEELGTQNGMLYGQLRQMHAEAGALEPLSLGDMEELERKLDQSARAVRDALLKRKIDEAQRRSSCEQASCAVCMEGPKAVVFNCGHQSCEGCSGKMTSCPFCRVAITARIRLFDA